MYDFIKEFYYGNIDPQTCTSTYNTAVSKELMTISKAEEYLTSHLAGEDKDRFLDFANAWSVMLGESNLDSFVVGFRLGAKFIHDTFLSNDDPLSGMLRNDD